MDFEKLNTFYHVANLKSLTQAAEELKMDKSSVSRQVALLEKQLGQSLFDRVGKQLVLTPEGEFLLERARTILFEIEATKNHLKSTINRMSGPLRIATTYSLASIWLSRFLHHFIEKYPQIRLEIVGTSEDLNLSLREADVAIRPLIKNHHEDLIQNHLRTWRLQLYASPAYVKKYGTPKSVEDLEKHRLITFETQSNQHPSWVLTQGMKSGCLRSSYISINSVEGMLNLVKEGVGIAPFSENLVKNHHLVPLLSDLFYTEVEAYFIYPKQYRHIKKITALENFLKMHINRAEKANQKI